jgi:hypothetical protein
MAISSLKTGAMKRNLLVGNAVYDPYATARGVFAAGGIAGDAGVNTIDYISIATTGNATDFGDLVTPASVGGAASSVTRGVISIGQDENNGDAASAKLEYVTIATTGNATTFGDLTLARFGATGLSNSTRALFGGGRVGGTRYNTIDYITIASTGNATDFGDMRVATYVVAGSGSSTRGLFSGGFDGAVSNEIQYVTIATTGNTTDFGDLTEARSDNGGCSNSTRSLVGGGYNGGRSNVIDYVTIATTGNAVDFGDISTANYGLTACSSSLRAIFAGGSTDTILSNTIDYVTISTTGNTTDFGDLTQSRRYPVGFSNGHGGL